jgi:hypothetical protein
MVVVVAAGEKNKGISTQTCGRMYKVRDRRYEARRSGAGGRGSIVGLGEGQRAPARAPCLYVGVVVPVMAADWPTGCRWLRSSPTVLHNRMCAFLLRCQLLGCRLFPDDKAASD